MNFRRYAIFHTPPAGALADFAAAWLGWDSTCGETCPHPEMPGLPLPVAKITRRARRYGFHGTFRAPFRLAAQVTVDDLQERVAQIAADTAPVMLPALRLSRFAGILALMPDAPHPPLDALARRIVTETDEFRALPDAVEIARRRGARLTRQQDAYLLRWGYPFVLDEFCYHMTLSGFLAPEVADSVAAAVAPRILPLVPAPYVVDGLSLLGEDDEGRFHQIRRFALAGGGV